jgi:hypothetical protein
MIEVKTHTSKNTLYFLNVVEIPRRLIINSLLTSLLITWILHESEAFIGKASKGDVVVFYFEPLATQHMKASGSPNG